MPWLPEPFLAHQADPAQVLEPDQTVPFYQGILQLAPETLLASWAGDPQVDDPRVGLVSGARAFVDYVAVTREWLALGDALLRPVSTLHTAQRSVEEVVLELCVAGERHDLPVGIVSDWDARHRLTSVRVYHSLWPLFPNHEVHIPQIPRADPVRLPPVVEANQRAREAEDADAILATYRSDAVVSVSGGGPHSLNGGHGSVGSAMSNGIEELRRLYTSQSVPGTRPVVEIRAAADDGHVCAVEYQVSHFAQRRPDQIGLTVFELGGDERISTERGYKMSRPALRRMDSWPTVAAAGVSGD